MTIGRTIDENEPVFRALTTLGTRWEASKVDVVSRKQKFTFHLFNMKGMADLQALLNKFRNIVKAQLQTNADIRAALQLGIDLIGQCQDFIDSSTMHIRSQRASTARSFFWSHIVGSFLDWHVIETDESQDTYFSNETRGDVAGPKRQCG